ncbi:MAG: hypothetical protein H0X31_00545 [Nostocaceae cyanobacterium]|nr:hypothetical protein [Nostocaceae cyanobacterium]
MSQTRIVLSPKVKPLAEELLEITGIDSLSSLVSVLLTRYGNHMKDTWGVVGGASNVPPQLSADPNAKTRVEFAPIDF